jgi:imidazolonepropionase-like amidohydrolase
MKVLRNARLIDGTGAGPVKDATIVVGDDRISAVTDRSHADFPADAQVIDCAGMTVLPGLIDCHDHMANHRYDLAHRWGIDEPHSTRHLRTAAVLRQTLEAGYTTIRDAGGLDAGFKRAIDEGLTVGPRLIISISIISPIGGIGDPVSPSGDSCCVPGDPLLPSGVVETLADVRPVVRRMVRAGADVIKCATTGGASSRPGHGPRDGAFNLDEMQELVDEAHALGRRVICHALGGRGLEIAIQAGVDSIDHGCYLDEEPSQLARMAKKGIFFVPTMLVYEYHRRALAAGVKVVAGTDAGGHNHPANAGELDCLVRAGMTPMQAIQAATGWAAECVGREADLGTVQKGKLADLVVVNGDPLGDITVLREAKNIALVLKGGEVAANRLRTAS